MAAGFLDTNVAVRYLTGDPAELATRAARIIDSDIELVLTDGVLAEVAYVLVKRYGVPRPVAVDSIIALIRKKNVTIWRRNKDLVIQALLLCRPSGRDSFADALLWAMARSAGIKVVYSFDERFPSEGITVFRHPQT